MKSFISLIVRCLNALLWSVGLSSVVLVLMLGFYFCWTKPVSKTSPAELASKTQKSQPDVKAQMVRVDRTAIFAGM